jgi:ribonucleoside-diphosphate reductase alpha chain
MLKKIIKRDGRIEDFAPEKLNVWSQWAGKDLGDRINWSEVVLNAVKTAGEMISSQDLQRLLIKQCVLHKKWGYSIMAGRLFNAIYRKELYDGRMPTVKELHERLAKNKFMVKLNYSHDDYQQVEQMIDHGRDFNMAFFQVKQIRQKYALQNRTTKEEFETPQFVFMRMAMALAEDEKTDRLLHVKNWYDHFSLGRINAPTPNYVNLGTEHNGYASCCLYTTDDTARSLAIGDHIAYTMTYMSSGIGGYIGSRSLGDPIRGGFIVHQGKLPYFASLGKAVRANLQGGRGGACTTYYTCFDPEVKTITMLQNPRTPEDKKNRDIHFAIMTNRLFAKKVARNEDIFVFNRFTCPELHELFFSDKQDLFEEKYNQYEKNALFKKEYISAREICVQFMTQGHEVATLYELCIDEANRHTAYKEPIYSSNLCIEILQPTAPYEHMTDLYRAESVSQIHFKTGKGDDFIFPHTRLMSRVDGNDIHAGQIEVDDKIVIHGEHHTVKEIVSNKHEPEVSLCSLGGVVVSNINNDDEYASAAYYNLKMIDKCIHKSYYELPHVGFTAKSRLNAGVGILGLAHHLARLNLKYDTQEGLEEIHRVSERHAYFMISASLKLGKELGNAPWMWKTKWPEGWLPIDTYKKSVDNLVNIPYQYDWEKLRQDIIANGGIRNSSLIAHMPTESSSKASGAPNGIYPIRDLSLKKTDADNVLDWCAPDNDLIENQYQLAWEVPFKKMVHVYAVIQKFTDQGISADFYKDRSQSLELNTEELITDYLEKVKYGVKSKYYQNSYTPVANKLNEISEDTGISLEALDIESQTQNTRGCSGESCTL